MDNQQFQPADTNQINQPSEPAQKPKFNLRYILIIGILAAIAAAGTIFYTRYTYNRIDSTTNFPELKILPKTENTDTASWQTYRNEKYGFEFKYPSVWKLNESAEFISIKSDKNCVNFSIAPINVGRESVFDSGSSALKKNIDFSGRFAKEFESQNRGGMALVKYIRIIDLKNINWGVFNEISLEVAQNCEDQIAVVNQILSTFKFIPSAGSGQVEPIDTSTWQTYRNEEFGFELKIPTGLSNYSVKRDEKIDDPNWGIKGKSVQYYFTVPYNKKDQFLFKIEVFTNEQWEKIYPVSVRGTSIIPIMDGEVIAENNNFTFVKVSGCLDCSAENPVKYTNPILSTFKFIQ